MTFISIRNLSIRRRMSSYFLALVIIIFLLSITVSLEGYAKSIGNMYFAITMTAFGYITRPLCIFVFVRLADHKQQFKYIWAFFVLLGINALVYLTAFITPVEALSRFSFYYTYAADGITLVFNRGLFNFTAHIISALFLLCLLYLSIRRVRSKHLTEASVILLCALFVVGSVIIEMLGLYSNLLNITVAIASVFYYLFLIDQLNHRDSLTDVLNRQKYFVDRKKLEKSINGIIAIDMNGLKFINDTYGHDAGDAALTAIGKTLNDDIPHNMNGYRVGGDEFIVLCFGVKEPMMGQVAQIIKSKCEEKRCYVSVGYAYRANKSIPIDDLARLADTRMYEDKAQFYKEHSDYDRRKAKRESDTKKA